jgi:VanZ family protein
MADKWVHFVLFAVFSLLWLCAKPSMKMLSLLVAFIVGCLFGLVVEELQGLLTFLGRSKSIQDIYADAIGSGIGVVLFLLLAYRANKYA